MIQIEAMIIFLKKIYSAWMAFAKVLGILNTIIFLSLLYFVIIPWIVLPRNLLHKKQKFPYWWPFASKLASEKNYSHQF